MPRRCSIRSSWASTRRFSSELHTVPHLTPSEHVAHGRATRVDLPRSAHARWEPAPWRRIPLSSSRSRPRPAFRSSSRSATAACSSRRSPSIAAAPAHGRGSRCGSADRSARSALRRCAPVELRRVRAPDRRLVFSINDFDETLRGPFEWDVKRLAASFAVAGREFGYDEGARRAMVTDTVQEYREAMASFATMRTSTSRTHASTWQAASPGSARTSRRR